MDAANELPDRLVVQVGDVAGVAPLLVEGLRGIGVDVEHRTLPRPAARSHPLVKVLRGGPRVASAVETRRLLKSSSAIAHVHFATSATWFVGSHPLVVHCHGSDVRSPGSFKSKILAKTFDASDLLIASTPDLLRWLPERARYLPNPADTVAFDTVVPPSESSRDVLVFARLSDLKGGMELLEVVRILKRLRPGLKISAIDYGPQSPEFRAAGVDMVAFTPLAELPALINDHRLVLGQRLLGVPGTSELQAMASGRVVALPLSDEVPHEFLPPVLDDADPSAAAQRILEVLDSPDQLDKLGARAREWTVANHSIEASCRLLASWYRELD